jgi:hypothetical protein
MLDSPVICVSIESCHNEKQQNSWLLQRVRKLLHCILGVPKHADSEVDTNIRKYVIILSFVSTTYVFRHMETFTKRACLLSGSVFMMYVRADAMLELSTRTARTRSVHLLVCSSMSFCNCESIARGALKQCQTAAGYVSCRARRGCHSILYVFCMWYPLPCLVVMLGQKPLSVSSFQ